MRDAVCLLIETPPRHRRFHFTDAPADACPGVGARLPRIAVEAGEIRTRENGGGGRIRTAE
jgi:hypothetical protein